MLRVAIAALLTIAVCSAQAADSGFNSQKLFFGIGVSRNDVSRSDNGTGTQVFGGYEFGEVAKNIAMDAEVGYMDTGDMDLPGAATPPFGTSRSVRAKGLWANGVARFSLNPQAELLVRAGLDFGDDDGVGTQKTDALAFRVRGTRQRQFPTSESRLQTLTHDIKPWAAGSRGFLERDSPARRGPDDGAGLHDPGDSG